jgi:hypothetical protein
MPLPVPVLDDRSFEQLLVEGRSLIPRYTREWTNHNVSDPGITLLELFAYLIETAIFQLDQVPEESIELFLRLVGECRLPGESVAAATGRALRTLDRPPRAVTGPELARTALALLGERPEPARAEFVALEDPQCPGTATPFADGAQLGVVTLMLGAESPGRYGTEDRLFRLLREHAPLATRLHVVEVRFARIGIRAVVARRTASGVTREDVLEALAGFLDPSTGGEDGAGWPFGRAVYRSELFQLLERLPGVDHVEELDVTARSPEATAEDEGVLIPPLWLVHREIDFDVTVRDA